VVILGMLWKRASPAGGFWGFLAAIVFSISMWLFVHWFPGGYRPQPKVVLEKGAVVTVEKTSEKGIDKIVKVIVQSGTVATTNVPVRQAGKDDITAGDAVIRDGEASVPATAKALLTAIGEDRDEAVRVSLLAEEVVLAGTEKSESPQKDKFGVKGVPVVLKPGVRVKAADVLRHFVPAAFNPAHVTYIARSEEAQEMAVNMYSALWTLCVCLAVAVGVSLFTRPKPQAELKNLVFGLTPLPDEGPCPWYQRPVLWAAAVAVVLVAINVIFW
jgi:hypothetical protein